MGARALSERSAARVAVVLSLYSCKSKSKHTREPSLRYIAIIHISYYALFTAQPSVFTPPHKHHTLLPSLTYIYIYIYIYICMYIYLYIYLYVYVCVSLSLSLPSYRSIYISISIYIYLFIFLYIYISIDLYLYTHIYVFLIFALTYSHTYFVHRGSTSWERGFCVAATLRRIHVYLCLYITKYINNKMHILTL